MTAPHTQCEVRTVDALRKQAFELSRDDQYRLAFFIAEHIGFGLARCTCGGGIDQPASEHDVSCPAALDLAQASISPREVLDALADKVAAKIGQLEHYKANDCQLDHAKTIAEGRISQANQILHWIAEAAVSHSTSVPSADQSAPPSEHDIRHAISSALELHGLTYSGVSQAARAVLALTSTDGKSL